MLRGQRQFLQSLLKQYLRFIPSAFYALLWQKATYIHWFFRMEVPGPKISWALWCMAQQYLKIWCQALRVHDSLDMAQGWEFCLCCLLPARWVLAGVIQSGLFPGDSGGTFPSKLVPSNLSSHAVECVWRQTQVQALPNMSHIMGLSSGCFNSSLQLGALLVELCVPWIDSYFWVNF